MDRQQDIVFMMLALEQARIGLAKGEVPVGAVVVIGEKLVGAGFNRPIALHDPTAHAEIIALREAARQLGTYRLPEATLYVTLEPCVMCVGAALNARLSRLCYGARDEKAGALGSVHDIGRDGQLNHRLDVFGGILAEESSALLRKFFTARRKGGSKSTAA
jgi:tRNA(adenine34) deaminase